MDTATATATSSASTGRFRARLAFLSPGILAALYLLLAPAIDASRTDRIVAAVAFFFLVTVLGLLGYGASFLAVRFLRGDPSNSVDTAFKSEDHLTAALLLATLVWATLQYTRTRTVNDLSACVDQNRHELQAMSPGALVLSCYRWVDEDRREPPPEP